MWLSSDLLRICRSIASPESDSPIPITHLEASRTCHIIRTLSESSAQRAQSDHFPLLQLPLDILTMHLSTLLPHASLVCLRSSCSKLHTAIPAPPKKRLVDLERCEIKVLFAALEEARERPSRMFCALCSTCYPIELFAWGLEKRAVQKADIGNEAAESLETIGARNSNELDNRVCRWHRARFERKVLTGHGAIKSEWTLEEACMHCGGVLAWGRCDCKALCQTCWKRSVWCHTEVVDTEHANDVI
ncbi:uncharacterized protein M437DRAFT_79467 [Aureobasidium melanogenum CBS 110374]|uniref:F-box domain-containing protein n=1 Tax=Aureobasidium melanogenum (strain CBS 110374) TaxID=1043003 RepID=A0A074VJQ0_AURM1|nr:uncharacterized protein M437DRAFT_79467 [Aureobasidium melanogenum CBS 110374]KEQ57847.1 hypothetical protein M437DRAFT_79467 [Aureobasidium melanogenum CBS 110374]